MATPTLTDIEQQFDKMVAREKTLPRYWGSDSDGTVLFRTSLDEARQLRTQHQVGTDAYKLLIQILSGYIRITNHTLDEAKKKPEQAFINYNVMCTIYSRCLNEKVDYETAIQTAVRKAHTVIASAKKDKTHWLRATNCWKKLFQ